MKRVSNTLDTIKNRNKNKQILTYAEIVKKGKDENREIYVLL